MPEQIQVVVYACHNLLAERVSQRAPPVKKIRFVDAPVVIWGSDVAQLILEVVHEIVRVVVFRRAETRFPVVQEIPDEFTQPLATGLIVLLRLALCLFVVMALDDRSARSGPEAERDNEIPSVFGVERHGRILSEKRTPEPLR